LTKCREESRYIGFPAILFVPTTPNGETAKSRHVFIHVVGSNSLVRLRLRGKSAEVEEIGVEREVLGLNWRDIERRSEYYYSLTWTPSQKVRVDRVETDDSGGILATYIEIRHPS
jgi:hypothetical protein